MKYKLIDEEVNVQDLEGMVREVCSYDDSLEEYCYYENSDEFFSSRFGDNIMEAVRATCYGDYNYTDDYVRLTAYGNLESKSEWDYHDELEDNKKEIIERYAELLDDGEVSEFKHLFEEVDDDE